jgi:hypothetical protein
MSGNLPAVIDGGHHRRSFQFSDLLSASSVQDVQEASFQINQSLVPHIKTSVAFFVLILTA